MLRLTCLVLISMVSVQGRKPNFLVILTDDQGFDDYGFRQPHLETPVMDKIMDEGVQFTRFYTGAGCAPTRSQLMTGREFLRTGTAAVGYGADSTHLDEYLLGEAMRDAGYVTGLMGKWNLGMSDADMPSRRGFDETWVVGDPEVRVRGRYDHFNAPFYHNGSYFGIEPGWQVDQLTDKGIEFMERHKAEPFFLYLPYTSPHGPWVCPLELQDKYMAMGLGEHYAMLLGMIEQLDTQVGRVLQALKDKGLSDNTMVFFFGDNGPAPKSNTIVRQQGNGPYVRLNEKYFLNATEWAERNPTGLRNQKGSPYENGYRNRLCVYCPAKFSSKKVHRMTMAMDIYPTMLDFADSQRKLGAPPLDGRSLRPLLDDGNAANFPNRRKYFLASGLKIPVPHQFVENGWYYRFTKYHTFPLDKKGTCFVLSPWVVVNEKGKWSLFKLTKDPQQKNDLKTKRPQKFAEMQKKYFIHLEQIRKDPHAWSSPIQAIGLPGVDQPYLEIPYIHRWKGKNSVGWLGTSFHEVGAVQQLKLRVLNTATYKVRLVAWRVPSGTKVQLRRGARKITATLTKGGNSHILGQLLFTKGEHEHLELTVLECDDPQALEEMKLASLHLTKVT